MFAPTYHVIQWCRGRLAGDRARADDRTPVVKIVHSRRNRRNRSQDAWPYTKNPVDWVLPNRAMRPVYRQKVSGRSLKHYPQASHTALPDSSLHDSRL